jgi:hypothetical protein
VGFHQLCLTAPSACSASQVGQTVQLLCCPPLTEGGQTCRSLWPTRHLTWHVVCIGDEAMEWHGIDDDAKCSAQAKAHSHVNGVHDEAAVGRGCACASCPPLLLHLRRELQPSTTMTQHHAQPLNGCASRHGADSEATHTFLMPACTRERRHPAMPACTRERRHPACTRERRHPAMQPVRPGGPTADARWQSGLRSHPGCLRRRRGGAVCAGHAKVSGPGIT